MRPRLLITRPLPAAVHDRAGVLFDLTIRDSTGPTRPAELADALTEYDAILPSLGDVFSRDVFSAAGAPRCRILANFGAGVNHIDLAAAADAEIAVTNTPGAVTAPTADLAMMLLLMSARRAGEGERLVRSGQWRGWHPVELLGDEVGARTLGIVGMGRIGQEVARRATAGFGMEVLFHNRSPKRPPGPEATQVPLDEVLGRSDFIVVTLPGGVGTRHLIDAEALSLMRPHAHLINVSRGEVVDEAALIEALREKRIAGAALDVYEFEPEVPAALRERDDVVLLPHLGSATRSAREAMGMTALDNLKAFFGGGEPANRVA
ncbi:2-hydroxyacid dehydrogenase [Aquamicrobium terrae]|uniref:Lactate dehydrogenase-like 2-hydroxyacid dehydrogenase n=1 Tax=Aquamicrobium terrae TaxID=1324945 RepID=A0ABV2N4W1_9HYPH